MMSKSLKIKSFSGVIPFHGFCMFAAPMCYVSYDPAQLYATFKAMYLRSFERLKLNTIKLKVQ